MLIFIFCRCPKTSTSACLHFILSIIREKNNKRIFIFFSDRRRRTTTSACTFASWVIGQPLCPRPVSPTKRSSRTHPSYPCELVQLVTHRLVDWFKVPKGDIPSMKRNSRTHPSYPGELVQLMCLNLESDWRQWVQFLQSLCFIDEK